MVLGVRVREGADLGPEALDVDAFVEGEVDPGGGGHPGVPGLLVVVEHVDGVVVGVVGGGRSHGDVKEVLA